MAHRLGTSTVKHSQPVAYAAISRMEVNDAKLVYPLGVENFHLQVIAHAGRLIEALFLYWRSRVLLCMQRIDNPASWNVLVI